jgi:hypothetical protein
MRANARSTPKLNHLVQERAALAEIARAVNLTYARRPMPPVAASILGQMLDRVASLDAQLHESPVLFKPETLKDF